MNQVLAVSMFIILILLRARMNLWRVIFEVVCRSYLRNFFHYNFFKQCRVLSLIKLRNCFNCGNNPININSANGTFLWKSALLTIAFKMIKFYAHFFRWNNNDCLLNDTLSALHINHPFSTNGNTTGAPK